MSTCPYGSPSELLWEAQTLISRPTVYKTAWHWDVFVRPRKSRSWGGGSHRMNGVALSKVPVPVGGTKPMALKGHHKSRAPVGQSRTWDFVMVLWFTFYWLYFSEYFSVCVVANVHWLFRDPVCIIDNLCLSLHRGWKLSSRLGAPATAFSTAQASTDPSSLWTTAVVYHSVFSPCFVCVMILMQGFLYQDWPWIHDRPSSSPRMLGLQMCATVPGIGCPVVTISFKVTSFLF